MLSEREILSIQQTAGIDRESAELIAAERYATRRAAQLEAQQRATGHTVGAAGWMRPIVELPWMSYRSSSEATAQPLPAATKAPCQATPASPNSQHSSGCLMCDGAGFYKLAVPCGHPQFGELLPCACKLAERERRDARVLDELRDQLQRYRDCRLGNFNIERPISGPIQWQGRSVSVEQQRAALIEAHRIATDFVAQRRGWLFLFGPPGSGKTRLAASVANEFRASNLRVTYGRVKALLEWLKAGFDGNSSFEFERRLQALERVPLLLIDDLGTEQGTLWERVTLENLLNERYNRELPTVLTSNLWRDELPALIADRIAEMAQVVWLVIESQRRVHLGQPTPIEAAQPGKPLDPWDRGEGEQ